MVSPLPALFFSPPLSGQPYRPESSGSLKGWGLLVMQNLCLSVLQPDLYFLSCLGTSGCLSGDWNRGLANPCFTLQPRRPSKKFQGNVTWIKKIWILLLFFYLGASSCPGEDWDRDSRVHFSLSKWVGPLKIPKVMIHRKQVLYPV